MTAATSAVAEQEEAAAAAAAVAGGGGGRWRQRALERTIVEMPPPCTNGLRVLYAL